MNKSEKTLFRVLADEDNIGLLLRGHLHVEHQLIKYIAQQLPHPERIDWGIIDFSGKVEFSLSCGLPVDIRPALEHLAALRNTFAYSLDAIIEPEWIMLAYNGLPDEIKKNVERYYKAMENEIGNPRSTLDTRDLLVLIFICVGNAINAETDAPKRKVAKIKRAGSKQR